MERSGLEKVLQRVRIWLPIRQRVDLHSSALRWAEYNRRHRALRIQFQSGATYDYAKVEPRRWLELLEAESSGRYFVSSIRNNYSFHKVASSLPAPSSLKK